PHVFISDYGPRHGNAVFVNADSPMAPEMVGRGITKDGRCSHTVYPFCIVVNAYWPSRTDLEGALEFGKHFSGYLHELKKLYSGRPIIMIADLNVALNDS
ncbi:unnamed protein product, partial [Amoebophrya sp. A25]